MLVPAAYRTRGGRRTGPWIWPYKGGSARRLRVTVRHVAVLHRRGETILEIAEALGITEAQVFHALSYFFDHRDEILALIAEEEQAHAQFRRP